MEDLLEMVLLLRMFLIIPPAPVTCTGHLCQKRAPWPPEAREDKKFDWHLEKIKKLLNMRVF
jgi:hypothetical protein